jgi:hypothetical protein
MLEFVGRLPREENLKKSMRTIDSPVSRFRIDGYMIAISNIHFLCKNLISRPRRRERN